MRLHRRPVLVLALFLAACGGNRRPLGVIEPVPGSRTREGGEIVPLDSGRTIRPLGSGAPTGREIAPIDTVVVPVDATTWRGSNYEGELTLEFLIGGILRYTAPSGTWTNGTWHQEGNTITFEMNSHFVDYTGRIRGTRMSGTAHGRTGRSWDWQATRQ